MTKKKLLLAPGGIALLMLGACDSDSPTTPTTQTPVASTPTPTPEPTPEPLSCIPPPPGDNPKACPHPGFGSKGPYFEEFEAARLTLKDEFPGLFGPFHGGWEIVSIGDYREGLLFVLQRDNAGTCFARGSARDEIWAKEPGPAGDPNVPTTMSHHYDFANESTNPMHPEAVTTYEAVCTPAAF